MCDEPKEGVMRASIPKIISIIKGLNLQSMLDSKTTRQTFSNEVYLAETTPDVAGLTHPRADLNEMSVHDLAKQKQDDLDYFARNFMGYIIQKKEIAETRAIHIDNMKKHRALEEQVPIVVEQHEKNLRDAMTEVTLTPEWREADILSRSLMIGDVKRLVKEQQLAHLKSYETEITKVQILLEASKKKFANELKLQQEVKTGVVNEIFQHMKEEEVPTYTKKDAENLFDEYIDIYENRQPKKEEILMWTDTLQELITLCERLEAEEMRSDLAALTEDRFAYDSAQAKIAREQLLAEEKKKEEERKKRAAKKKRQKKNRTRKKREEAERAAKEAKEEALRLRAEELEIQEKEDAALAAVAKPNDEGMSKEEEGEVPLSSLDEQLISRITELYEYLQTQDIFKSERIKRKG